MVRSIFTTSPEAAVRASRYTRTPLKMQSLLPMTLHGPGQPTAPIQNNTCTGHVAKALNAQFCWFLLQISKKRLFQNSSVRVRERLCCLGFIHLYVHEKTPARSAPYYLKLQVTAWWLTNISLSCQTELFQKILPRAKVILNIVGDNRNWSLTRRGGICFSLNHAPLHQSKSKNPSEVTSRWMIAGPSVMRVNWNSCFTITC